MVSRSSRNSNRMLGIGIMLRAEVREEIVRKKVTKYTRRSTQPTTLGYIPTNRRYQDRDFCGDETAVAA
jgi:hypothetical protein